MLLENAPRDGCQVEADSLCAAPSLIGHAQAGDVKPPGDRPLQPCDVRHLGGTAAYLHGLDSPAVNWMQLRERTVVMRQAEAGKGGWLGTGVWAWTVISQLVMVMLVVVSAKLLDDGSSGSQALREE
ncbi:MAG: hypothetical protein ABIJ09_02025 [Pseudomonadota bacterium]